MRRPEGTVSFSRARNTWQARLWVEDAKGSPRRLQRTAETQKGAREALAKLIREHRVLQRPAPTAEPQTLDALYDFLSESVWNASLSDHTRANYASWYRLYLAKALGPIRIEAIRPEAVQRVLAAIPYPTTANRVRNLLRSMLNAAKRFWGDPIANPVAATVPRKQRAFDPRILTIEEARGLLESADARPIYGPIVLALACGLRKGEVSGLTWENVKRRELVVYAEKTGRYRTVPLPPAISGYLTTLDRRGPFVFPRPGCESRWDHSAMHRDYHAATVAAGLGRITFHCLRSTWASRMVAAGTDVRTLMELGGWSEVATLMEIYARASATGKRNAIERVAEALL